MKTASSTRRRGHRPRRTTYLIGQRIPLADREDAHRQIHRTLPNAQLPNRSDLAHRSSPCPLVSLLTFRDISRNSRNLLTILLCSLPSSLSLSQWVSAKTLRL